LPRKSRSREEEKEGLPPVIDNKERNYRKRKEMIQQEEGTVRICVSSSNYVQNAVVVLGTSGIE
jgi:hypothetical protein